MTDLLNRLKEVLLLEFDTLTGAKFDRIQDLLDEKLALIEAVQNAQIDVPRDLIEEVRTLTDRNNILYEAALDGLSIARDRLETLREAQEGLTTYSNDGRRTGTSIEPSGRETRA